MPSGDTTKVIGSRGEKIAARYLKKNGYKIIEKNYFSAHGEIDIIAKKDGVLVFVEVKARKDCQNHFDNYGMPSEAVTKTKQQHIIYTAHKFLEKNSFDTEIRFDVIEVFLSIKPRVHHIEDAFFA